MNWKQKLHQKEEDYFDDFFLLMLLMSAACCLISFILFLAVLESSPGAAKIIIKGKSVKDSNTAPTLDDSA